ncbi:MAG: nucleotide exchange factor GrpE [Gemmataceae bacterium]|nr:nucleotide exchange factor GrpE [Gemmataceae bacterium]
MSKKAEKVEEAAPGEQTPTGGEELAALKAQLLDAEKNRDEFLSLVKATRADFENYQKRAQREQAQEKRFAHAGLAADILSALDNLDRAMEAAKKAGDQGPLVQGVTMVSSQFLEMFRRHGVEKMKAEGSPFDPNQHQAVLEIPTNDQPPSTVVQVLENGYTIHDRVLRPARVAVSKAPPAGDSLPADN